LSFDGPTAEKSFAYRFSACITRGRKEASIYKSLKVQGDQTMKKLIFSGMALATLLSLSTAHAQTVGQDLKGASHDTADASKTVAHKTVHGTKVAARDTVHGTKVAARDTAHGTKVAARDTVHGTKVGAHKTAHATRTGYHKTTSGTKKVTRKVEGKPATTRQ
jgi:hypothetical protein